MYALVPQHLVQQHQQGDDPIEHSWLFSLLLLTNLRCRKDMELGNHLPLAPAHREVSVDFSTSDRAWALGY
jgi:hypothetical protein